MERFQIIKSQNHDHFWCENNIIYESYKTIRGLIFIKLIELNFNYPDKEKLTETMIIFLNNIFSNNKGIKENSNVCPICNDNLMNQVNSLKKNCVNCGYSSFENES